MHDFHSTISKDGVSFRHQSVWRLQFLGKLYVLILELSNSQHSFGSHGFSILNLESGRFYSCFWFQDLVSPKQKHNKELRFCSLSSHLLVRLPMVMNLPFDRSSLKFKYIFRSNLVGILLNKWEFLLTRRNPVSN